MNNDRLRAESWTYDGSDWTIHSILQHQLYTSEIGSCEESSYFPLPKELRNLIKGFINV